MKTDRELYRDVVDELGCDGRVGGMDIDVDVDHGVVTLTGWVETLTQRQALERAVEYIEGVRGVRVDVDVKPVADPTPA